MKKIIFFVTLSFIVLTSCGEKKVKEITEISEISEKSFVLSSAWMRPGAQNRNSAAFLKITNNMEVDDTLFAVQSDLAKITELHETYEKENDMMGMRHVDYLVIPSKSAVELKPGSFHIMLIGLKKDLVIGDSGKLTLEFKNAGKAELPVSVQPSASN